VDVSGEGRRVAAALVYFRKEYEELRPGFSLLAIIVGLVAIAIWICIDPFYPKYGSGAAFDQRQSHRWRNGICSSRFALSAR